MKEHKAFIYHKTIQGSIEAIAKEYDEGWEYVATLHEDDFRKEMILSREIPSEAPTPPTPPFAYVNIGGAIEEFRYSESDMRQAIEKGIEWAENRRNTKPSDSDCEQYEEFIEDFIEGVDILTDAKFAAQKSRTGHGATPYNPIWESTSIPVLEPSVAGSATVQETPPIAGYRPSDELLWKAMEEGVVLSNWSRDARANSFLNWLDGLPTDPLEADRKTINEGLAKAGLHHHYYGPEKKYSIEWRFNSDDERAAFSRAIQNLGDLK